MDVLAGACQREDSAKAGNVMRPHVAESWQGAASTPLTVPCALWTAAEKLAVVFVALLPVLLVLAASASDQQNSGAQGSGACERTTRTPTRAPVKSIGSPRMAAIEHRAHTHATSHAAAAPAAAAAAGNISHGTQRTK